MGHSLEFGNKALHQSLKILFLLENTVQPLMKCRIMRHFICSFTVCRSTGPSVSSTKINLVKLTIRVWAIIEALPGVLGTRGNRAFISGNKGQILRETGEQRQYWGTGNIRKQIFDFWGTGEQANLFQGNKGTGIPWDGLIIIQTYVHITNINALNTYLNQTTRKWYLLQTLQNFC